MNATNIVRAAAAIAALAVSTTTSASAAGELAVQPALAAVVATRAADLSDAGIQRVAVRPDRRVQVLSIYGPSYFAAPAGAAPFQIDVGPGSAVTVRANGFDESSRSRYAAAFDAVLPQAIQAAHTSRAYALRPRP